MASIEFFTIEVRLREGKGGKGKFPGFSSLYFLERGKGGGKGFSSLYFLDSRFRYPSIIEESPALLLRLVTSVYLQVFRK